MTDEQIVFSITKMKEYGIVDSGDTLKLGIGAMTDDRWSEFYNTMVKAGVVKAGLDYKKAYTAQFVNKGVGLDSRGRSDDSPLLLRRLHRVVGVGRQGDGDEDRRLFLRADRAGVLVVTAGTLLRKAAIACASSSVRCERAGQGMTALKSPPVRRLAGADRGHDLVACVH